ncbi:MAG TPA: hypothetical protein PL167_07055 [Cyclobacteriaceae bacterium]|nr:hypothetical protein [Cyclobacteriaceae bacterium]
MKDYTEFQFGWIIFVIMIPLQIMIFYFYLNDIGDRPLETNGFLIINLIIILIYSLFYGMTTRITDDSIRLSFGIGLIRKTIQLNQIMTIETVKNPWYFGWGVRFIPNGMLYNITGTAAIELKFKHTNKVFRIGSKDPLKLKQEIEKGLSAK